MAGRTIEFPPGSGHRAFYEPHELDLIQALARKHDAGEISDESFRSQIWWIHGLKSTFDARILPLEDGEPQAEPLPEPDEQESLFEIPRRARDPFV